MTSGAPTTLSASSAPKKLVDVCRTVKRALAYRRYHFDIPSEPHLDELASGFFHERLAHTRNYLEYGSGGSTILANRVVERVVSVDSDGHFLAAVRRRLAEEGRRATVKLIHVNIGLTLEWGMPAFTTPTRRRVHRWEPYPAAPWRYYRSIAQQPDLILVDGRFRVACVLESLLSLSPVSNSVILVDDYRTRPEYRVVERFADLEMVGRMAVLHPRRLVDRIQVRRLVRQYCADPR